MLTVVDRRGHKYIRVNSVLICPCVITVLHSIIILQAWLRSLSLIRSLELPLSSSLTRSLAQNQCLGHWRCLSHRPGCGFGQSLRSHQTLLLIALTSEIAVSGASSRTEDCCCGLPNSEGVDRQLLGGRSPFSITASPYTISGSASPSSTSGRALSGKC